MKRHLGTLGILGIGFLFGSITPLAGAHPEHECQCDCPPCDSNMVIIDHPPMVMESPVRLPHPNEVPLHPDPDTVQIVLTTEDSDAIQKARDAIEAVDQAEAEEAAAEEAAAEEAAED